MLLIKSSLPPSAARRASTRTLFQVMKGGKHSVKMASLQTSLVNNVLFNRSYATGVEKKNNFNAVVVGDGPAGLAVVGNLLEQKKGPILWIGRGKIAYFGGGRLLKYYRAVPSNTKVKFFTMFADALKPFREITRAAVVPNPYNDLKNLDQEKTCPISAVAKLAVMLGRGLVARNDVLKFCGSLQSASWSEDNHWDLNFTFMDCSQLPCISASCDLLFLCTGSYPTHVSRPEFLDSRLYPLQLDTCLDPKLLELSLRKSMSKRATLPKNINIAVIGASHSAILVLRNLYELASHSSDELGRIRIKWLARHELRYAEERDGWIKHDNTGLKGEVAAWAKENLEADTFPTSDVSKYLEKVKTSLENEQEDQAKHLKKCVYVVQAIGFTRKELPVIERNGTALDITYDHETSGFVDAEGKTIRGLYGAGIAFPEKVVDPEGTTEYAVGLWKFMKYLKRVAPTWTA